MPAMQKRDDRYKWAIRDAIMTQLFSKMETLQAEVVRQIAVKNLGLMGYTHLSFLYNGLFYSVDGTEGPPVRQRLHRELFPEAKKMEAEFGFPLAFERNMATNYISSVLAQSPRPGDYLLLLPPAVHDAVKKSIMCSDWSTSLSPEKIASFMAKYQKGYDLIRERLAFNLLL